MTSLGRTGASPLRLARKIAIAIIGTVVLALGVALAFLPGPAFVVIPIGLAILATEFAWARRLLTRVKSGATRVLRRHRPREQS